MANTFKLKTLDKSSYTIDTLETLYTVPGSTTAVVLGLSVANITGASIEVDIQLVNADGDDVYIVKDTVVDSGGTLEMMSGNKYVLETGDIVKVASNATNSFGATISIMEIT
tara:strand:+ start:1087 stop:1422 length:336 start_codon:yes stop_codon:yes gene_type:complete